MRQRHRYGLAFLLVVVAAAAGSWWAARRIGPVEVPQVGLVDQVATLVAEVDLLALLPAVPTPRQTAQPAPTASPAAPTSTAQAPVGLTPTPQEEATGQTSAETPIPVPTVVPTPAAPGPTARPTATPAPPTPTPTAQAAYPFVPAGPVRHTSGDCPGPSIRGVVRDAAGNGLAGVRLWRYDQWGNQQTVESKSAAGEVGRYDFPLGDTPNVHYVQVVDAGGVPISPRVEVPHRQGEAGDNACHWLDWIAR